MDERRCNGCPRPECVGCQPDPPETRFEDGLLLWVWKGHTLAVLDPKTGQAWRHREAAGAGVVWQGEVL